MGVVEGLLAVVGLVTVLVASVRWQQRRSADAPPEVDRVTPYREALHAAMRMQVVGEDHEQQIRAEAIRRASDESGR